MISTFAAARRRPRTRCCGVAFLGDSGRFVEARRTKEETQPPVRAKSRRDVGAVEVRINYYEP